MENIVYTNEACSCGIIMTENKLLPATSLFTISYTWAHYIIQHFTESYTKSLVFKTLQLNTLNHFILCDDVRLHFVRIRHWKLSPLSSLFTLGHVSKLASFFHCLFKSYFPSNLQIHLFLRIRRLSRSRKGVIPFDTLLLFSSTDLPVVHQSVLHFSS